jgi:hypothetical protein
MRTGRLILTGFAAALTVLISNPPAPAADAQRPCKDDIAKFCKDVRGRESIQKCLREHGSELSAGCKGRMEAGKGIFAKSGAANDPFFKACEADQKKFCAGVAVGKGRVRRCLRGHLAELSAECKAQFKGGRRGGASFGFPCQEDLKKHCEGVKPGEGRVLACLREHEAELSDGCRKALPPPAKAEAK